MAVLIVKLASGRTVKAVTGSYAVEQWSAGKWRVEAVYPPTKAGYEKAEELMNSLDNKYVRIQQYF